MLKAVKIILIVVAVAVVLLIAMFVFIFRALLYTFGTPKQPKELTVLPTNNGAMPLPTVGKISGYHGIMGGIQSEFAVYNVAEPLTDDFFAELKSRCAPDCQGETQFEQLTDRERCYYLKDIYAEKGDCKIFHQWDTGAEIIVNSTINVPFVSLCNVPSVAL